MTPGTEPALSAEEWLSGMNRGRDLTLMAFPGFSVMMETTQATVIQSPLAFSLGLYNEH